MLYTDERGKTTVATVGDACGASRKGCRLGCVALRLAAVVEGCKARL